MKLTTHLRPARTLRVREAMCTFTALVCRHGVGMDVVTLRFNCAGILFYMYLTIHNNNNNNNNNDDDEVVKVR